MFCHLVPHFVDQDGSCLVLHSETLDAAIFAILADIDVLESAPRIDVKPLVVLLSGLNGAHVGT